MPLSDNSPVCDLLDQKQWPAHSRAALQPRAAMSGVRSSKGRRQEGRQSRLPQLHLPVQMHCCHQLANGNQHKAQPGTRRAKASARHLPFAVLAWKRAAVAQTRSRGAGGMLSCLGRLDLAKLIVILSNVHPSPRS